jgi:microcystin-dependent protein
MADPNLEFSPTDGWENTTTFPTNPVSQAQTRSMMQRLFTQIQTFLNTTLVGWVNSTFATKADLAGAVLSGISDNSITDAKLSGSAGTVKTRVNTYLAEGGISDDRLSPGVGSVKTLSTAHYIDWFKHGLTGTTDSSGSTTVYTLTPSPAITAYTQFQKMVVIFDKTNAGSSTLNISGLGAKTIKKITSVGTIAIVANDIVANTPAYLIYDGTDLILLNPVFNSPDYTIGKVDYFAMSTAPTGYLKANGAAVSRTTYAALYTAIGTTFGVGDGSTTFNLPDMRGVVPRGWDDGRGYDSGRAFGSYQADGNKSHSHTGGISSSGAHTHTTLLYAAGSGSSTGYLGNYQTTLQNETPTSSNGSHDHTVTINADGNTEVTVKNVALLAVIKY